MAIIKYISGSLNLVHSLTFKVKFLRQTKTKWTTIQTARSMDLLADESEDEKVEFKINTNYAKNYETWRKKEERQRCT